MKVTNRLETKKKKVMTLEQDTITATIKSPCYVP